AECAPGSLPATFRSLQIVKVLAMSIRLFFLSLAVIAATLAAASPAAAQPNVRNPRMQQQMQKTKTSGTLVSANASQMQVATSTNESVYVMVGQGSEVTITGTAEQDYLKPSMFVEFTAEVGKGGKVDAKIDHLTICSQSEDRPAGLSAPDLAPAKKKGTKD